jgi:small subunit ribosomal protein S6
MSTKSAAAEGLSPERLALLKQIDRIGLEQTLYEAVVRGLSRTPDNVAAERATMLRTALDSLRAKLHANVSQRHAPVHSPDSAEARETGEQPRSQRRKQSDDAGSAIFRQARSNAVARAQLLLCCRAGNRVYEYAIILSPTLDENARGELIRHIDDIARSQDAKIVDEVDWGVRRLAYNIAKYDSGYYYFVTFEAPRALTELDRRLSNNDSVIRFQAIRIDDEMSRLLKHVFGRDGRPTSPPAPPPP